ncbi:acyl transferase/acyl hydrolase/lysophospholipase [Powellomyces hirtus]|nr:acyl transferase/acyl hydrolase/lysophospholipase [Powellomyces hirtus]
MDPGTSTEEEFLEEEFESELLAEERREQAQSLRKKKSREILTAKNRWWALAKAGRTKSFLWVLLRWPLLIAFCLFISVDLTCYVAVRQWVRWYEWAITWRGKRRRLRQDLNDATTYEEYKVCARKLDEFLGNSRWKNEEICPHYDVDLVHRTVRRLRRHRSIIASALRRKGETSSVTSAARSNATAGIMKVLQHGACKHNFGGIENEALYSHTYLGTKKLVEEFVHEICQSLMHVAESTDLTSDEKHDFFKKVSQNYGRTALCLSGGATLGYYHDLPSSGVVKSLYEEKLLPNIITGTSAGSLIAALICCRTDQELVDEVFVPSIHKILTACDVPYMERAKRMYKTGAMFDHREWYQKVMLATKGRPLTFWEAYQRTGRVLNIAIVPDEPHSPFKLCNYITTPNVVVATAVMASSAVPGVLNPVELLIKTETGQLVPFHGSGRKWRDGSLMMDIPERELHRLWNVNFTIVSQVNPHIVLFFFDKRGSAGSPTAHRYGQGWRGGFIASALVQHFKLDLQKWMTLLKDFELLPRVLGSDVSDVFLQRFEGDVTIVPRATLEDYRMILTDPTNERMKRYIERGEARTWPKLHMIANRLAIEKTLSKCRRMFPDSGNAKLGSAHGRRGSRYSNTWSAVSRSPRWLTTIEDTAVPAETLEPLDISQTE